MNGKNEIVLVHDHFICQSSCMLTFDTCLWLLTEMYATAGCLHHENFTNLHALFARILKLLCNNYKSNTKARKVARQIIRTSAEHEFWGAFLPVTLLTHPSYYSVWLVRLLCVQE